MARFEDEYEFNLKGNFRKELESLSNGLEQARADWSSLKKSLSIKGTTAAEKSVEAIAASTAALGSSATKAGPKIAQLADSATNLRNAFNSLVRAQNALNVSRAKDAIALDQLNAKSGPRIIQARGEARAIRAVAKAFEDQAFKAELAALAKQRNLQVSADGTRIYNAQAAAIERIAKAEERAALARELAKRGRNLDGTVAAPVLSPDQARAKKAQEGFEKEIENLKLKEQGLALRKNSTEWQDLQTRIAASRKEMGLAAATGKKTEGVFNRVSFTFRRLIGIMAAFTIARVVTRGFADMIAGAVQFKASLEQTRVGLAGLISAAGDVRPISGEQVGLDEKLNLALDISIDQMKKLRGAALETAATYEDLANAFQTAVAPGLQAGLTLDQIRDITVDISQAGSALGVAQNQLSEEIRSLFQGTITPKNTRIATALGIDNEDIRRAKQAGELAQFLETRFAAISKQGEALMNTFTGALSNATDAYQQLLADSSGPLFEQLKGAFQDLQETVDAKPGADKEFLIDPKAVSTLQNLFQGLANGVSAVRSALKKLSSEGLSDVLSALGEGLGLSASLIANTLVSAFNAATPLFGIFAKLLQTVNFLVTKFREFAGGTGIGQVVILFLQILLAGKGILFFVTKLGAVSKGLATVWTFIKTQFIVTEAAALAASAATGKMAKAAAVMGLAFKKALLPVLAILVALKVIDEVYKGVTGESLGLIEGIGNGLAKLNNEIDTLVFGAAGVAESATSLTGDQLGLVINDFKELRSELKALANDVDIELTQALRDLDNSAQTLGLPQGVASQFSAFAQAQDQLNAKTLKAQEELLRLRKELVSLDNSSLPNDEARNKDSLVQFNNELEKALKTREAELDILEKKRKLATVQIGSFGSNLGITSVGGDLNPQDLERYRTLELEILNLKKSQADSLNDYTKSVISLTAYEGKRKVALDSIKKIEDDIYELKLAQEAVSSAVQLRQAEDNIFQAKQSLSLASSGLAAAEAENVALATGNALRAESLRAEAALSQEKAQQAVRIAELNKGIQSTRDLQRREADSSDPDIFLLVAYDQQASILQEQLSAEEKINAAKVKRLQLEARLATLREKGSAFDKTNGDPSGFEFGLADFANQNASSFNLGETFGRSLADGVTDFAASSISSAVAAAFDPSKNFDLREAAGNFLLSLGTELLSGFLKQQLAVLLQELSVGALTDVAKTGVDAAAKSVDTVSKGADAANKASETATATSMSAAATALGAAATGLNSAVLGLSAAATALNAAATQILATAGLATGGRSSSVAGGLPTAAHRTAPGFALGGRPRGLDPRDTIPAWLRPGEWVIRPEAVSKYGDSLFHMLNRGKLNPDMFRGLSSPKISSKSKIGFATGGKTSAGSQSRAGGATAIYQFHDEQTLDRALAAGDNSMVRFTRKRRSAFRAALGLEAGS